MDNNIFNLIEKMMSELRRDSVQSDMDYEYVKPAKNASNKKKESGLNAKGRN